MFKTQKAVLFVALTSSNNGTDASKSTTPLLVDISFCAKAYGEPYVNYATKVMLGKNKVTDFDFNPQLKGYAIKQPVFSFSKFHNVNKALGPEMKSTGESILFIDDLKDDQFYELYSRRKMYLSK